MDKYAKVYVAGHKGMVGSAIVRNLKGRGYDNLILRTIAELDLTLFHSKNLNMFSWQPQKLEVL